MPIERPPTAPLPGIKRRADGVRVSRLLNYPVNAFVLEQGGGSLEALADAITGAALALQARRGGGARKGGRRRTGPRVRRLCSCPGVRAAPRRAVGRATQPPGRHRCLPPLPRVRPLPFPRLPRPRAQAANQPFNMLISACGGRAFLVPQCYAEKQAKGVVPEHLLATGAPLARGPARPRPAPRLGWPPWQGPW
jgi:hypothetical protein